MVRRGTLGLREQIAYMRLHWPEFQCGVRGKSMFAEGELVPSSLSRTYRVRITQAGEDKPEVRVVSPKLRSIGDQIPIPHMYGQERLCLYLPGTEEWTPNLPIAVTIVPWASLWLYFYELWHATGEWLGGGVEPDISNRTSRRGET